jgi:hypothetical protein
MKTRFLIAVLFAVCMLTTSKTHAQDGIGLGGELFSNTGLSYKIPVNESSAVTGAFGFLLTENGSQATLDVGYTLYLDNDNINIESGRLSPYAGGELTLQFIDGADTQVGIAIPFGLEYQIDNAPVEIYMDIGPFVRFNDPLYLTPTSSLGFRYRF